MPENRIITKEKKIKPSKARYEDFNNYAQRVYTKVEQKLPVCNVLANENYSVVINERGMGYSKYKDYVINRFEKNADESQGIFFYLKNIRNKRIWTSNYMSYLVKPDKYEITFSEDSNKIKRTDGGIESICKITLDSEKNIEFRRLELTNYGIEDETVEITAVLEPVLSKIEEYSSHPAFQNLFLVYEYIEEDGIFVIKRKNRTNTKDGLYLAVCLYTEDDVLRRF